MMSLDGVDALRRESSRETCGEECVVIEVDEGGDRTLDGRGDGSSGVSPPTTYVR